MSAPRQTTRPIASIIIGERLRLDMGDVADFARSVEERGLIQPIVIRPDGRLVAGARRLEALRLLGQTEIPVTIKDGADDELVLDELAENVARKGFTPSEIDAARLKIEALERARAKARQGAGLKRGAEKPVVENFHDGGKTRDKIGAALGISGRTVDKIAAVVEAAKAEPERFGKLAADMDRTGLVNGPFKRLKNIRQAEAIRAEPPPFPNKGPLSRHRRRPALAVRDPRRGSVASRDLSLSDDDDRRDMRQGRRGSSDRARGLHPVAVDDELPSCARPSPCSTHGGLSTERFSLWVKHRFGYGDWLRNQTEHVHHGDTRQADRPVEERVRPCSSRPPDGIAKSRPSSMRSWRSFARPRDTRNCSHGGCVRIGTGMEMSIRPRRPSSRRKADAPRDP